MSRYELRKGFGAVGLYALESRIKNVSVLPSMGGSNSPVKTRVELYGPNHFNNSVTLFPHQFMDLFLGYISSDDSIEKLIDLKKKPVTAIYSMVDHIGEEPIRGFPQPRLLGFFPLDAGLFTTGCYDFGVGTGEAGLYMLRTKIVNATIHPWEEEKSITTEIEIDGPGENVLILNSSSYIDLLLGYSSRDDEECVKTAHDLIEKEVIGLYTLAKNFGESPVIGFADLRAFGFFPK